MLWKLLARILSTRRVSDWLIQKAIQRPFTHLLSPDGTEVYMFRFWLFNPYPSAGSSKQNWFPISIRLHHIQHHDQDDHLHDHPWNARTIILRGYYVEERANPEFESAIIEHPTNPSTLFALRRPGDTARINFGEFHRIHRVTPGGVWTVFITGRYRGTWGFLVDGVKVPWRTYLAERGV